MTVIRHWLLLLSLSLVTLPTLAAQNASRQAEQDVASVLEQFHHAASIADGEQYFRLLSDDAVFMGTDASERWSKAEFMRYAEPYFQKKQGWLYQAQQRHITLNKRADIAWFDEVLLNKNYGLCRSTGVLYKTPTGWKIAQYSLSVPLPNAIAKSLVKQIQRYQHDNEQ